MVTTVYTDGACINNPGPGGWAWAVPGGAYASGSEPETTNQRMELTAALQGLWANPGPLLVMSHSKNLADCFVLGWHNRWAANGWKNASGKPIGNQDLWQSLLEAYHERDGPGQR